MVRLSRNIERQDALRVLEADRRRVALQLESDRPLRKSGSSCKRRTQGLRATVERDVAVQLDEVGRMAFRGPIAVQLELETTRDAPRLWRMVKAYQDALIGPIVDDDSLVEHLIVTESRDRDEGASVRIECLPIAVFSAEFDRAFRLADETGAGYEERHPRFMNGAPVPRDPNEWGLSPFGTDDLRMLAYERGVLDRVEEIESDYEWQMDQDPDGDPDLDLSDSEREFADPEVRAQVRREYGRSTARSRAHQFADQGFDVRERPGPDPDWLAEVELGSPAEVVALASAGPGCFVLPAPPTTRGHERWTRTVGRELAAVRQDGWHEMEFPGSLALDVAVIGGAAPDTDLDNLARQLINPVEHVFSQSQAIVSGYRAYRIAGAVPTVRLRLMPIGRLLCLKRAMSEAAAVIKRQRASRERS